MLAGLIRDEERTVLAGVPGLSDLPLIGRLFANNHKETTQTDIILTLTPHIVRMLDVTEADLRPFRLGRGGAEGGSGVAPAPRSRHSAAAARQSRSRRRRNASPGCAAGACRFRSRLQPTLPGATVPVTPPKKPGGGGKNLAAPAVPPARRAAVSRSTSAA